MLCQQGCLHHSIMAQGGPADPRLCCSPGHATLQAWGGLGTRPGQAGGAEVAFPEGQGRSLMGALGCHGQRWLLHPERPTSTGKHSGMERLLLRGVLQPSLALAAGASLSPALLVEQTCGAVKAGTFHTGEGRSVCSSAHPWEIRWSAHLPLRRRSADGMHSSFPGFSGQTSKSLAPGGRTEGECCCCCTAAICHSATVINAHPIGLCCLKMSQSCGGQGRAGQGKAIQPQSAHIHHPGGRVSQNHTQNKVGPLLVFNAALSNGLKGHADDVCPL